MLYAISARSVTHERQTWDSGARPDCTYVAHIHMGHASATFTSHEFLEEAIGLKTRRDHIGLFQQPGNSQKLWLLGELFRPHKPQHQEKMGCLDRTMRAM
ncbi:hypothetical protein TRAPUB_5695 [Trametes pubescens]|uniref:Uncharacterized protein n=1 Tax=Trametes pubescens TaxID=154538 RepID=A0A1M2V7Z4_TRAPU|nr:hypothetical protein TRAPUB_5695 [Trametes pubescens]